MLLMVLLLKPVSSDKSVAVTGPSCVISSAISLRITTQPVADLKKDVPCGSGLVYDATSNRCRSGLARDVGRIRSIM